MNADELYQKIKILGMYKKTTKNQSNFFLKTTLKHKENPSIRKGVKVEVFYSLDE